MGSRTARLYAGDHPGDVPVGNSEQHDQPHGWLCPRRGEAPCGWFRCSSYESPCGSLPRTGEPEGSVVGTALTSTKRCSKQGTTIKRSGACQGAALETNVAACFGPRASVSSAAKTKDAPAASLSAFLRTKQCMVARIWPVRGARLVLMTGRIQMSV